MLSENVHGNKTINVIKANEISKLPFVVKYAVFQAAQNYAFFFF